MVNYYHNNLDVTFGALADPTRRAIVKRLAQGNATVKELAKPFRVSLPAISKHLRVLEDAGLLRRNKQGRIHHCQLNTTPLKKASDWMTTYQQFWEQRFDFLEAYLHSTDQLNPRKEKMSWGIKSTNATRPSKSKERSTPQGKKSSKRGHSQRS